MIKNQACLKIVDNSNGKIGKCFKTFVFPFGFIGAIVNVSIKKIKKISLLKIGLVKKAIIVRNKINKNRLVGNFICFNSNDVVLLSNQTDLIGTRIFGPLLMELKQIKHVKILSIGSFFI